MSISKENEVPDMNEKTYSPPPKKKNGRNVLKEIRQLRKPKEDFGEQAAERRTQGSHPPPD